MLDRNIAMTVQQDSLIRGCILTGIRDLNFDCKQLRSFLTVVEEKSFTMASRKLGVGQATISHHIILLEKNLGVQLIKRSSKDFVVTKEGLHFKAFCEKLFIDLDFMLEKLEVAEEDEITRIASSTIPSTYILPDVLQNIRGKVPGTFFSIQVSDSREVIEKIKEKTADIGIAGRMMKHPSLVYHKIFYDEIVLISAKDKYPDSIQFEELKKFPFVTREKGSGTREGYERILQKHEIRPSDLDIVLECSTSESLKEAVLSGVGMAFISILAIQKEKKLGTLKIIRVPGLNIKRDFYLVHHKRYSGMRIVDVFLDEVAGIAKKVK